MQSTAKEPEPGPSIKRPRLEEHLTSVYNEDTVSLGDDDDDPFTDMYDELDGMVLDCYNATSMDIGAVSRPVLPIGSGRRRRREIDERARDVWLVELARDWGRRGTSRVGVRGE